MGDNKHTREVQAGEVVERHWPRGQQRLIDRANKAGRTDSDKRRKTGSPQQPDIRKKSSVGASSIWLSVSRLIFIGENGLTRQATPSYAAV